MLDEDVAERTLQHVSSQSDAPLDEEFVYYFTIGVEFNESVREFQITDKSIPLSEFRKLSQGPYRLEFNSMTDFNTEMQPNWNYDAKIYHGTSGFMKENIKGYLQNAGTRFDIGFDVNDNISHKFSLSLDKILSELTGAIDRRQKVLNGERYEQETPDCNLKTLERNEKDLES